MLRKLFATDDNTATAILRVVLGVVFFAHGAQKMLGWFGGFGFSGTMGYFTAAMHIPAPLALLAIAAEFFGRPRANFGIPHPNRRLGNRDQYGRSHRNGT